MKTNTHIIIKREDIYEYLTHNQIKYFDAVLNTIADGRKKDGKKPVNSYYICNTDEAYAGEVLKVILKAESEDKMGKKSFEEIKDRFGKYGKFREEGETNE